MTVKHKQGIFKNEPNEIYHSDNGFISSSALKLLLEDVVMYKAKYIDKTIEEKDKDAYIVGNAYHTKILEPHKYDEEYTTFKGTKRGEKWEKFKEENKNKRVLGNIHLKQVNLLVKATEANKHFKKLNKGCEYELSIYVKLFGKYYIKVRFDAINRKKGYAYDLKSTTGLLIGKKGTHKCLQSIASLDYDLSAALYLDVINYILELIAKKKGEKFTPIKDWYWVFASKDLESCKILQASEKMLQNGREKYMMALDILAEHEATGWKSKTLEEGIEIVDPLEYDLVTKSQEVKTW